MKLYYGPNCSFLPNCSRNGKKQMENIQGEIKQEGQKVI
jgi:hypothetical protein